MKTLYIECNMGAAGDMLMAGLLELHDNPQGFLGKLNTVGIPGVVVTAEASKKCGITGTYARVKIDGHEEDCHDHEHTHDDGHHHCHTHNDVHTHHTGTHEHAHNSYHEIEHLIGHLRVSDTVKENALAVYKLIADAESRTHGVPIDKIHFHEVGEMDAVADIVGVCMLMEELSPDIILASPINTGSGHVTCAHGILPVPAPATALILRNVPIYNDSVNGELCTPTGAALLKHFVNRFCKMPLMVVDKVGYGMGKKDFEKANCVRVYVGNITDADNCESVIELSCNIDDMTPEAVTFAQELLLREGALDVWTTPIGMKKGRAGIKFSCLCDNDMKEKMTALIFKHTTTLGIRENVCHRYTLQRELSTIQTKYGTVRIKNAHGYGTRKTKAEYDDIADIARRENLSIHDVLRGIAHA